MDEIREKLRKAGIPLDNEWAVQGTRVSAGILSEKQKKLLDSLEALLVAEISKDTERVADLHVRLQTLKHGGR